MEKTLDDPGCSRFGNFINYYSFNLVENRLRLFPNYFKYVNKEQDSVICLDVGCNVGELTHALHGHLEKILSKGTNEKPEIQCHFLAVDLDEHLIDRAVSSNRNSQITFSHTDVLSDEFQKVCSGFLKQNNKEHFDVVFCFSLTMWIHLNHGDEGLNRFLHRMSKLADLLVIEPQPWKCYYRAVRRVKRANGEDFEKYEDLKIRKNVETHIDEVLVKECGFKRVLVTSPTPWGRQVTFYKKNQTNL